MLTGNNDERVERFEFLEMDLYVIYDDNDVPWVLLEPILLALGHTGRSEQIYKELRGSYSLRKFDVMKQVGDLSSPAVTCGVQPHDLVGVLYYLSVRLTPTNSKYRLVHRLFGEACVNVLNSHFATALPTLGHLIRKKDL